MGRTKTRSFDLDAFDREPPRPREVWMARHAVPGGIITAIVLGVGAGIAFGITAWWLGVVLGVLYAAVGIALWAQPVRKVGAWRRARHEAERAFAPYAGAGPSSTVTSGHAAG